jgi:peptidoglycan/xylan/chitin deacetylase (PgdA/CDA1 family)
LGGSKRVRFGGVAQAFDQAKIDLIGPHCKTATKPPMRLLPDYPKAVIKLLLFLCVLLISGVGYLITVDYSVTEYVPTDFKRGILSITFDDGMESQYVTGLPLLQKYNLSATFYLTSGFLGKPHYMSAGQALDLKNKGNEIASHTITHPHLRSLTANELYYELEKSKEDLANLFQDSISGFASPFGEYNTQVLEGIKKYYSSHRTVNDGFNSKDKIDVHQIKVQNIKLTTTTDEVKSWLNKANHDKSWLVLVYH